MRVISSTNFLSLSFLSRVHGRFSNWARVCIRNSGMLFYFLCLIRIVINFLTIRSKSPVNLCYYLILLRSKLDRQLTTYVSTTNIYIYFFLCLLLFHLFFFFSSLFCHCQCLLDNNNDSRMTQLLLLTDRQMFLLHLLINVANS